MINSGVIRLKLMSGAGACACKSCGVRASALPPPFRAASGGAGAFACQPIFLHLLALLCLSLPLSAQQRYLPTDVELGSRLYRNNCFACHGQEGASIPGVDFRRGQFKRVSSDEDLFRVILTGIPGTAMPPTNISDSNR